MNVVYVAYPYRADTEDECEKNVARAVEYARELSELGYVPYVPHLITVSLWGWDTRDEKLNREITKCDMEMLSRCDVLAVCGERISAGMRAEIEWCAEHDKKILCIL